jgi:hypothetical protein
MICLLPNCCFLSETSRMLEIYRALREREGSPAGAPGTAGIKVVTHGGPYESLLRAAGVPYDVLGPDVGAGWSPGRGPGRSCRQASDSPRSASLTVAST